MTTTAEKEDWEARLARKLAERRAELPPPGLYVLTQDVENPRPDRRRKGSPECEPVWEKGREVVLRIDYSGRMAFSFFGAKYCSIPDAPQESGERFRAILPHIKRVPDTGRSILREMGQESYALDRFIAWMVDSGRISGAHMRQLINEWHGNHGLNETSGLFKDSE